MSNPTADFPAALHTRTDTSAFGDDPLGGSTPDHTDVHGKVEEELYTLGRKLGTGSDIAASGEVLFGTGAGTSAWRAIVIADVTSLQSSLDAKASLVHTHSISDVTGLQAALDAKAAAIHSHAISDVTGLQAALDAKQTLDSDLTAIAALSPSNDDIIQRKGGLWVNRSMAQLRTDLAIGIGDVTGLTAALASKESSITAGTIAQYWRGDKTFQVIQAAEVAFDDTFVRVESGDSISGTDVQAVVDSLVGVYSPAIDTLNTTVSDLQSSVLLKSNNLSDLANAATARINLGLEIGANVQAFDTTLAAFAAYNTNGILTQTAPDSFTGRTITGTTNQVVVSNGNGVSGNPILSLPQNIHTGASPTFAALNTSAGAVTQITATNTAASSASGGAGIIGQIAADPTAADHRLGFYLFGANSNNQVGISGWSGEIWSGSARGTYLVFETTNLTTTSRSERARIDDTGIGLQKSVYFRSTSTFTSTVDAISSLGAGHIDIQARGSIRLYMDSNNNGTADVFSLYNNGTSSIILSVAADGGHISMAAGATIISDTTTGIKIATATNQKLGFYNATPIVQPTGTTDLRTALINLGLYASGGASPLDLNGGAFTTTGNATVGSLLFINAASGNPEFDFQEAGTTRAKTYYDIAADRLTFQNNQNGAADAIYFADPVTASANITLAEAANIIAGTTTGTKIGTATSQKLGFYNSTPIIQPATTGTTTGFTANTSVNNVFNESTFTGNTGSTAYTISDIVRALKLLGLMAA